MIERVYEKEGLRGLLAGYPSTLAGAIVHRMLSLCMDTSCVPATLIGALATALTSLQHALPRHCLRPDRTAPTTLHASVRLLAYVQCARYAVSSLTCAVTVQ